MSTVRVSGVTEVPAPFLLPQRVDHWLARGFGAKALRARDRASWRAALAELEIADHFEARGFTTRGLDQAKGQQRGEDRGDELNISLRLELEQVAPLVEFEPRAGSHGGPSVGGYRPG